MFSSRLNLVKTTVNISKRYSSLDGLRLLHLSDFHLSGRSKSIEQYISKLSSVDSDFIFVTGDLIDCDNGIPWVTKYLSRLSSTHGTWISIGNHDRYNMDILNSLGFRFRGIPKENNVVRLKRSLIEHGIHALINQKETFKVNNTRMTILGTDIPFGYDRSSDMSQFSPSEEKTRAVLAQVDKADFTILLNHIPDLLTVLQSELIDLALCGHTHGGQFRLPFIGPVIAFSKMQRKYNRGLYRFNGYPVNVSSGLGTSRSTPGRFNCPPEAYLITIKTSS